MIKSIKEIINIGVFSNFSSGASIRFEKLNFIYGLNTYGKTTLTDIFQSLASNDSAYVISRKTIPEQTSQQKVVLSILAETNSKEKDLIFQNGSWGQNKISSSIEVFGSDFIHKNIFTGLIIERGNRENFTQFILGEQGVFLAESISKKRQELGIKRREINNKIPGFVNGKSTSEIEAFLNFKIDGLNIDNIEKELSSKRIELQNEQERLKEPSKILNQPEPQKLALPTDNILEKIQSINNLLTEDYESIKEESINKLNKHILKNFSNSENAENWIKSGLNYCKNHEKGDCPFCGQSLSNARNLIELYNTYFDEAYNSFINKIENGLNNDTQFIENVNYNRKSVLQTNCSIINQYKDLIKDNDFQANLQKLEKAIEAIREENLNIEKNKILNSIKNIISDKIKKPYQKTKTCDFSVFELERGKYFEYLEISIALIDSLINNIDTLKNQYRTADNIHKAINNLNKQIATLEYQKARIEQDADCKDYQSSKKYIIDLEIEIQKLDKKLQIDQSKYIEDYFSEIDNLFKKFGSKNFLLGKEIDTRGHLPVYSINVKYHNKNIPNDKLAVVFSESDRRALALAVFWAKINLKSEEEKQKTIIILDDPITSFDDNRLTNSINNFIASLDKISQLIVLTHYTNFIKRFVEISRSPCTTQFLKIQQNAKTSLLNRLDLEKFLVGEFQKIFLKLYGYVNRWHNESIKADLRPFLENLYLPKIFAKHIEAYKITGDLNDRINRLCEHGAITESHKTKLHEFRNTTNPDSHLFTTNNEEDLRNFASEMLDFLFSLKFEDVK